MLLVSVSANVKLFFLKALTEETVYIQEIDGMEKMEPNRLQVLEYSRKEVKFLKFGYEVLTNDLQYTTQLESFNDVGVQGKVSIERRNISSGFLLYYELLIQEVVKKISSQE